MLWRIAFRTGIAVDTQICQFNIDGMHNEEADWLWIRPRPATTDTRYVPSPRWGNLPPYDQLLEQNQELVEDAVKYIIFLVDADRLFDTALGMYDFSLVLMIAQHAQKVNEFCMEYSF